MLDERDDMWDDSDDDDRDLTKDEDQKLDAMIDQCEPKKDSDLVESNKKEDQ